MAPTTETNIIAKWLFEHETGEHDHMDRRDACWELYERLRNLLESGKPRLPNIDGFWLRRDQSGNVELYRCAVAPVTFEVFLTPGSSGLGFPVKEFDRPDLEWFGPIRLPEKEPKI